MENRKTFRDLKIWRNGMLIAKEIYKVTKGFPKDEIFGLVSQMRRRLFSVPSNIAEGRARSSLKDFCQSLHVALGSLAELKLNWYKLVVQN